MQRLGIYIAAIALALTGCMVGPKYQRPSAFVTNAVPANFAATNGVEWSVAQPGGARLQSDWWKVFGDAELNRLEGLASASNQELAASLARFEEARAQVNVARSDLYPHLSANPSLTRQRTSQNIFDRGTAAGVSHNYNTFTVALEAGWELDLWGRVRREVQATRARLNAASDDIEAVRLAIQAEIGIDYFTERALEAEVAGLRQTVEAYARSLELTKNRRAGGVGTDLDVSEAETQLRSAEAQVPLVELQRVKLLHALATLCGVPATSFTLNAAEPNWTQRVAIPGVLPSELLERRPDIAAAERRVAAANAEIGVAQTAFYPRIRFNGLAGFQSITASTLFDWPSRVWSLGPSLELPIFTGGRNRAELALARATYQETTARYRQTVLTAFQEVEDQLASQRLIDAELQSETAAMNSARRTLEIANNRYKAGLVTYLEVASAQSVALAHERTVVRLAAERLSASVGLAKALGGGWQPEQISAAAPSR